MEIYAVSNDAALEKNQPKNVKLEAKLKVIGLLQPSKCQRQWRESNMR